MAYDREYKEHFEHHDLADLERLIEEAMLPKEGEEVVLDEEQKMAAQRKIRFKILQKSFYCPHEQKPPRRKLREFRKESPMHKEDKKEDKKNTKDPKKEEQKKVEEDHNELPQYVTLVPEQWKKKILSFAKYNVIKMPRVF